MGSRGVFVNGVDISINKAIDFINFSHGQCLSDTHKYNQYRMRRVYKTARNIIQPDIQQLTRKHYHVDHVYEFRKLVADFVKEEQLDIVHIPVREDFSAFTDRGLTTRWLNFHRLNASLRSITATSNLKRPRPDMRMTAVQWQRKKMD